MTMCRNNPSGIIVKQYILNGWIALRSDQSQMISFWFGCLNFSGDFSLKQSFLSKSLEAPRGCGRFTNDFNTDNLMWGDNTPKYSVTCGMDDDRFLSFDQIIAEPNILHPISTNVRQNGGANSCKIACNPGTISQYPGKKLHFKFH